MRYVLYIKGEWTIISERKELRSESMRRKKKLWKKVRGKEKKESSFHHGWNSPFRACFQMYASQRRGNWFALLFHYWLTITHFVYILTDSEYSIKLSFDKITMLSLEGRMYRTPLYSFWAQLHAERDVLCS